MDKKEKEEERMLLDDDEEFEFSSQSVTTNRPVVADTDIPGIGLTDKGPVATRPVNKRPVANRLVVVDPPRTVGPVAAAAAPVAVANANAVANADEDHRRVRPRGRASGIRKQEERFQQLLFQLANPYRYRGRGRGRGQGQNRKDISEFNSSKKL